MPTNSTLYYDRTAAEYDRVHGGERDGEHVRALERAWPIAEKWHVSSVLDVGCGTGRSLMWCGQRDPALRLAGIDPSEGLLAIARDRVPGATFEVGHGERLPHADGSVDMAVATGIMHHVDRPGHVIREMFRVAKSVVLISDHNNFAFGGSLARRLRLGLYASGLLGLAMFVRQGFRRQGYSNDDGWWYPYSLLDDYGLISRLSSEVFLLPTCLSTGSNGNFLLSQSHVAILAIKANTGPDAVATGDDTHRVAAAG